jgi:hypothetical protein
MMPVGIHLMNLAIRMSSVASIHLMNLAIRMSSVALSELSIVISIVVPTFVELFVQSRKETPVIFKSVRLNMLVPYIYSGKEMDLLY